MPNAADPQDHDFSPGFSSFSRSSFDRFQSPASPFSGPISDHAISSSLGGISTVPNQPLTSIPPSLGMFDRDQQQHQQQAASNAWAAADPMGRRTANTSQVSQGQPMLPTHLSSPQPIPGVRPTSFAFDGTSHPFAPPPSAVPERDAFSPRSAQSANSASGAYPVTAASGPVSSTSSATARTLYWADLEPWMDEEYAKQVVSFMKWDAVVQIPPAGADNTSANNPGYCYLTFSTPSHAAAAIAQIHGKPVSMPNSNQQFNLGWASAVPAPPPTSASPPNGVTAAQAYAKEYSIFVGDLAPEASNSDLVAVFRNPVLGLRNDREPKFIRPFASCKSAKIMLDPVTGISRGYGFVRFTDEADQQRALIEMHGLYCLSRPMRISPATAKFRPPPSSFDLPQVQVPPVQTQPSNSYDPIHNPLTSNYGAHENNRPFHGGAPPHVPSMSPSHSHSGSASKQDEMQGLPPGLIAQLAQASVPAMNRPNGNAPPPAPVSVSAPLTQLGSVTAAFSGRVQQPGGAEPGRHATTDDSVKYQAQVRAILSNLIGPNGEQLTSTDPYNTTVFVGGLSPLISEETLRTFFSPFGDIHYVKVPAGKHCGFVQFVRKNDAERAIEKMQGFPIGGSRIRLSWGRSQYKAAQAAAQAAQNAAMQLAHSPAPASASAQAHMPRASPQHHVQPQPVVPPRQQQQAQAQAESKNGSVALTPEQAIQLLRSLGFSNLVSAAGAGTSTSQEQLLASAVDDAAPRRLSEDSLRNLVMARNSEDGNNIRPGDIYSTSGSSTGRSETSNDDGGRAVRPPQVAFSPFTPEPQNGFVDQARRSSTASMSMFQQPPAAAKVGGGIVSPGSGIPQHTSRPGSGSFSQASLNPPVNAAISRPPSSKRASPPRAPSAELREQDSIEDVNGTLASLDLNSSQEQDDAVVG